MKLIAVPGSRSAIVELRCNSCGSLIEGVEPAIADLDQTPSARFYHRGCVTPTVRRSDLQGASAE